MDSLLEEDGFELAVPPRRERLWAATPGKHRRLGPEPVSGSAFHAAVSDWQRPEEPFAGAGPMVRIRFPPAKSLRTIGSSQGLTRLPRRQHRHLTSCLDRLRCEGWLAADDLTSLGECIRGSKDLVAQYALLTRSETLLACRHSFQLGLTASRAH